MATNDTKYSKEYQNLRKWLRAGLLAANVELTEYANRLNRYVSNPDQYLNVYYSVVPELYRRQVFAELLKPATTSEAYQIDWIRHQARKKMASAVNYRGSNPEEALAEARAWSAVLDRMDLEGLK